MYTRSSQVYKAFGQSHEATLTVSYVLSPITLIQSCCISLAIFQDARSGLIGSIHTGTGQNIYILASKRRTQPEIHPDHKRILKNY